MSIHDKVALENLLNRFSQLGWYSGIHNLVTLRLQGGFEAFTGRATEDWEHQYVIVTAALPDLKLASFTATAKSIGGAAEEILRMMPKTISKN